MLNATKVYHTTVRSVGQQRVGSLVAKRLQSTSTTTAKKSSFGKKLIGTTIVAGAAYGGAVYYATHDADFHDAFTTYVPGAAESVAFVKEHSNDAADFVSRAQEYSNKTMDAATGAYAKLTGDQAPAKAISPSKDNKAATKPVAPVPEKAEKQEAAKPRAPPIVIHQLMTNHAVIQELSRVVSELASILNEAGLSDEGREVLSKADADIKQLNARWQLQIQEHAEVLKAVQQVGTREHDLAAQVERLHAEAHASIQSSRSNMVDKIQAKQALQKEEHKAKQEMLQESFKQIMVSEANQLTLQLAHERQQALMAQADELKRQFMQESRLLIEHERAARLRTLDNIYKRFSALEDISVQQAVQLDQSRLTHQRYVALSAVQDCIDSRQRQPFREEWQALRTACDSDPTLTHILASVDRHTTDNGIASHKELADRYDTMAGQVRRVALVPDEGGFGAHILSLIMSKLLFKKHGLVEGDDVEAVLARSLHYLEQYDVENAARELNQLQGWPKRLAADWIQTAREHLEVKQVLDIVETQVLSASLVDA
ncbi:mitochondrial inner membrane protein-domain-containing protein [Gongronella butleri]|nr:mitochondrial inner membrane protein-domain-containing protein [Gongronella butleri]